MATVDLMNEPPTLAEVKTLYAGNYRDVPSCLDTLRADVERDEPQCPLTMRAVNPPESATFRPVASQLRHSLYSVGFANRRSASTSAFRSMEVLRSSAASS